MRGEVLAFVVAALVATGAAADDRPAAGAPSEPAAAPHADSPHGDTLKERLSDKASDEQRVNDCHVPPERRGAKKRPVDCAPPPSATIAAPSR